MPAPAAKSCGSRDARSSPIERHGGDIGGDHEAVDAELSGQQRAAGVLVDDGLDAVVGAAVGRERDGNTAAARCDDQGPALDQPPDGLEAELREAWLTHEHNPQTPDRE